MHQQDYIKRIIEQLSTFLKRLLKIDIEKDSVKFIETFDGMLERIFKIDSCQKLLNKKINFDLIKSEQHRDEISLSFYKMALILLKEDVKLSKSCYSLAEEISGIKIKTFSFLNNDNIKIDIERIKKKIHYE